MFKKVLVSDDLDSSNQGVFTVLKSLGIEQYNQVQYCDDAYLQIKKAQKDGEPFDLLITDLSFQKDHRNQKFEDGEKLIEALRNEHPDLKIIIYSDENRYFKVMRIISDYNIEGYVSKGRQGLVEIQEALKTLLNDDVFISAHITDNPTQREFFEISDYDLLLLQNLSNGFSQDEISKQFEKRNIVPSSRSSIEKRLNRLRIIFKAKNGIHLISIAKDLGVI